jgi:lysyl-tRNA synthetase class 1
VYFGEKKIDDQKELAKLRGLYEYTWLLKPPKAPRAKAPYNLLVYLVKVAPRDSEVDYVAKKLAEYGYLKVGIDESFKERLALVRNWAEDFEQIEEVRVTVNNAERSAILELVEVIRKEMEERNLQNAIFETAKRHSIPPAEFFQKLYLILLGAPKGPRLGPYILAMGKQNVAEALKRAVADS